MKVFFLFLLAFNNIYVWAQDHKPTIYLPKSGIEEYVDFEIALTYDIIPKKITGWKRFFEHIKSKPDFTLTLNLPPSIPGQQEINSITITPEPTKLYEENDNQYAEFTMSAPDSIVSIDIYIAGKVFKNDFSIRKELNNATVLSDSELQQFLINERMIETDSIEVLSIAHNIQGATKTEIIKNIYSYIIKNIEPEIKHKGRGAEQTAKTMKGMCIDWSDLFVALCRAKNIPARTVAGYKLYAPAKEIKHAWPEVYFEEYGWVPFDVSINYYSDKQLDWLFCNAYTHYIKFTGLRNDPIMNNVYFYNPHYDKQLKKALTGVYETIELKKPFQKKLDSKKVNQIRNTSPLSN